ncbi:MAG: LamG-like jellyroll fold domain-containing protein [Pseudomonadota bacterium]
MTRLIGCTVLLVLAAGAAADGYLPDLLEFDGTDTLVFDPAPQFDLSDGGTLEFWVSPDWTDAPDYDPIVLCNAGGDDIAYAIGILRDRNGLLLVAGDGEDIFPADLDDGRMHHIALHQLEDGVVVLVDGEPVGTSGLSIPAITSDGLWLGSLDGENDMFAGAIAGFRVWDTVVDQATLVEFAFKDAVFDDHPYLDELTAISDFEVGEVMLVDDESIGDDEGDAP